MVNCVLVTKRERWVKYLMRKVEDTSRRHYSKKEMIQIKKTKHSQHAITERISQTITKPTKS